MGILTNFLKLLKPEPNDFVDVVKHISENYDKLDLNAKSNNETLTNLSNNKLDKGTYSGNAVDLKDEIDKVASTTQLGRIKVGTNLRIDENGFLHGNPAVDISGKLDKGDVPVKYDTAEKIGIELDKKQNSSDSGLKTNAKTVVGAINENYEKFKNFCPFPVNSIFLSLDNSNPATLFFGTTWQKQEGRFLLGSSSTYALGSTGGNSTITLTEANMPRHRHIVDSFSVTTTKHTHRVIPDDLKPYYGTTGGGGGRGWYQSGYPGDTGEGGGDNTGTASPYTNYIGNGTAFNNMPPYLVVNIWKRLT